MAGLSTFVYTLSNGNLSKCNEAEYRTCKGAHLQEIANPTIPTHTKTGPVASGIRAACSFPFAILAILVGKAFWTCRDRIADPDLGWHLRNGQYILAHARLPSFDSFSFTAAGSPWLDHSWIPEALYALLYRCLGLTGIFVLFAVAVAALMVWIFRLCLPRAEDPLAAAVATILGSLLAMVGFTPRPQLFAWLCFIGMFSILIRFRERGGAALWLIPFLFCLWINCHGSWALGLATLIIFFFGGLIPRDIGTLACSPWSRAQVKKLTITLLCSIAALFVNPFGWKLVLYPLDLAFRQTLNVGLISEWASVNFNDLRGIYVLVAIAAVFVLALIPRRPWRIDDALLVAFAVFCGLKHIRFLVLTGIVLPPIVAPQIPRLSTYDVGHERRFLNGLIVASVCGMLVFWFPSNQLLQSEINQFFPSRAVSYVREHHLKGNIFNQYEWGGYLEWQIPELKVFVDSRTDIFEHKGVLGDYLAVVNIYNSQQILDEYHIDHVLFSSNSALAYFLSTNPQWECVYRDNQAVLYRRVNG